MRTNETPSLSTDQVAAFVELARQGSLRRAAEVLIISEQGLRNRLSKSGVAVVTVKPGLIDTPMTASVKKGLLAASAQDVGEGIYRAVKDRKEVVYLPWFWRPIMLIVRSIPEPVFKRLSL